MLAHIERLTAIREIGLPPDIGRDVPLSRLSRIAREGPQTAVYQIQEYGTERRHATIVAIIVDTAAAITDEILNLHDRLIGSFFTKDKNRYERHFAADGNALNEKVRLYAQVGSALIGAKEVASVRFAAIEGILPWDRFTASVRDAQRLARDEDFDYSSITSASCDDTPRRSLETFEFRGAPIARELLAAVDVSRVMKRTNVRKVPADAPVGFLRRRWKRYVFADGDVGRRYYEFAVMSELQRPAR